MVSRANIWQAKVLKATNIRPTMGDRRKRRHNCVTRRKRSWSWSSSMRMCLIALLLCSCVVWMHPPGAYYLCVDGQTTEDGSLPYGGLMRVDLDPFVLQVGPTSQLLSPSLEAREIRNVAETVIAAELQGHYPDNP
eukprot:scaffold224735_cov53-Attheya_sp.AAC.1